jgi:hypothetical protein
MAKAKKTIEDDGSTEPESTPPAPEGLAMKPSVGRIVHVVGWPGHERCLLAGVVTATKEGDAISAAIFLPNGQPTGSAHLEHVSNELDGAGPRWSWPERV